MGCKDKDRMTRKRGMRLHHVSAKVRARIAAGDSIYEGWGANQGFVTTSIGAVVVDTGFTSTSAKALLRDLRATGSAPVKLIVNTHDHSDHVFGNSVFDAYSPLIMAHLNCRSRLLELGKERMRGYRRFDKTLRADLTGLRISPPQVTYEDGLELDIGQTNFRFIHPKNGAHTTGDTMVLLPDEKILFAGDVLWTGYHPNLEDADIEAWLQELDAISRMKVDLIVPGHGKVSDKSSVAPLATYLREFDSRMSKLVRDGVPKASILPELEIRGSEEWSLKMIVQRNLDILYDRYVARERAV